MARNLFLEVIENMRFSQVQDWELAKTNYENLQSVESKKVDMGEIAFLVQFNPKRIVSSAAKVDAKSIQERKCFLCQNNLPLQQKGSDFIGKYSVLVNPFPIFPKHLTIPSYQHQPQQIKGKFTEMLVLAQNLEDYVVFYNGPKCGASAPDHFHFQAGNKGFLPIETNFDFFKKEVLISEGEMKISQLSDYPCSVILLESKNIFKLDNYFNKIHDMLEVKDGEYEPMINIVAWMDKKEFKVCIFPRIQHRPSCYFAEGEENLLISPASVDLGGVFITPRENDYRKITANDIRKIVEEVCLDKATTKQIISQLKISIHE